MTTVTFLVSMKTWANAPNLQESLGWLIEEAVGDGVWDVDGMKVVLCPDHVSDVVVTPLYPHGDHQMKLYQKPDGNIVTYTTINTKVVGDTDDGWVINTGTSPPKDAMIEALFRGGQTASELRPAHAYYWYHEGQSGDIMAYRIIAPTPTPKPKTFSKIKVGDVVTVELTVTKVETRYWTTMFSCDTPEWFEAEDAIGYVAPPPKPKIEAGQVRQIGHLQTTYLILRSWWPTGG